MSLSYKQKLNKITTFIFDVDGVLTDGSILLMPTGEMTRVMNTKDGYAMKYAIQNGYRIAVITGGRDQSVKDRLETLGVQDVFLNAHNKMEEFFELTHRYDLKPEEIIYMGDDMPDIPVLKEVGLSTCPQDAVSNVREVCEYISPFLGGKGCVRDIIEQTLKAQGKWELLGDYTQSV